MNRQLDIALVLFALTVFCGIAFVGQMEDAVDAQNKSLAVAIDDNANQATRDYYRNLADKNGAKALAYLGGTAVLGITSLTLGFRGTQKYFKDKRQAKYDIEERRHQELLEATRQAHRQAQPPTITLEKSNIDQILSEEQRTYKEGNIDLAIFVSETTNDPRPEGTGEAAGDEAISTIGLSHGKGLITQHLHKL